METMMEAIIGGWLEVGAASRPFAEGEESGDAWTIARRDGSAVLAVADGVGHGSEAASAARRSMAVVEAGGISSPERLLQRCHDIARGTRGVAMSLASVDPATREVAWLGVGNVAGAWIRRNSTATNAVEILRTGMGLVGDRIPALHAVTFQVAPGDQLVLATDGVSGEFAHEVDGENSARETAERILRRHATGRDDALVVVARFLKWPS